MTCGTTLSHFDGTVPAADINLNEANLKQIDAALADAVPVRGRIRKAREGGTRPWQSSRSSASG